VTGGAAVAFVRGLFLRLRIVRLRLGSQQSLEHLNRVFALKA